MVNDGDTSLHHDSHQLVDLAALCNDITQTSAAFCALLETLAPSLLPPDSMQAMPMAMTPASVVTNHAEPSMDANDGHHHDCRCPVDFSILRHESCHNSVLFSTLWMNNPLIANITKTPLLNIYPQLTMTTTDTMDDDDDYKKITCYLLCYQKTKYRYSVGLV